MVALFQRGEFTLHSGVVSLYKIEMDALTDEDWATLAFMLSEILPPFFLAAGIPEGGLPLSRAMKPFASDDPNDPVLLVDDVATTGASLQAEYDKCVKAWPAGSLAPIGAVVFSRSATLPSWVTPLFQMTLPVTYAR